MPQTTSPAVSAIGVIANEAFLLAQVTGMDGPQGVDEIKRQVRESVYWPAFVALRRAGEVKPGDVSNLYGLDTVVLAMADAET